MANLDAIVSVKVFIQPSGATKTFRFGTEMCVGEVIREIKNKSNITQKLADHGLFMPANPHTGKRSMWMERNKALRFYNVQSDATIEFKKKHRPLKIQLPDGTKKIVVIDDSAKVREIVEDIGKKIGLKHAFEYSLRKLPPPVPVEPSNAKKSKKGADEEVAPKLMPWLNENKCLHDEGVTQDEELEYRKKYFVNDNEVEQSDPFALHLLYMESVEGVVKGYYPTSRTDARNFAAFAMQVMYGDHNPAVHVIGYFDKNKLLPAQFRKDDKKFTLEKEILATHKKLVGVKEIAAKHRYVQLVRSLKFYGITFFFNCKEKLANKKEPVPTIWGISKDKIVHLEAETFKEIKAWRIQCLRRWDTASGKFLLDFGQFADKVQEIITPDAEQMAEMISGYIDIILRMRTDKDRVVENDDDDIGLEVEAVYEEGYASLSMVVDFVDPYGSGASGNAMYWMGDGFYDHSTEPDSQGHGEQGSNVALMTNQLDPHLRSSKVKVCDLQTSIKFLKLLSQEVGGKKFILKGQLSEMEWSKQFKNHQAKLDAKMNEFMQTANRMTAGENKKNDVNRLASEIASELKGMAGAAGCLTELDEANLPLLDGTKAQVDVAHEVFSTIMRTAEASGGKYQPPLEDIVQELQMAKKTWDTSKALLVNPSLANYADKGSELLLMSCVQDVNVNMLALIEGLLDLSKIEGNLNFGNEFLRECHKMKHANRYAVTALGQLIHQVADPDVQLRIQNIIDTLAKDKMQFVGKLKGHGVNLVASTEYAHLVEANERVETALYNLQQTVPTCERRGLHDVIDVATPIHHYLTHLAALRANINDTEKVKGLVKDTVKDQNKLTELLKKLGVGNKELEKRVQNTVGQMTVLNKDMMMEAVAFIKDPTNLTAVGKAQTIIGKLEGHLQELLTDAGEVAALHNLRYNAKASTAAMIQLASFATNLSSKAGNNNGLRDDLLMMAKNMHGSMGALLQAIHGANDPANLDQRQALMQASEQQMPLYRDLADLAAQLSGEMTSPNEKKTIDNALRVANESMMRLQTSIGQTGTVEDQAAIEDALQEFDSTKQELVTASFFADQGLLKGKPGLTRDAALEMLQAMTDDVDQKVVALIQHSMKSSANLAEPISQLAYAIAEMAASAQTTAGTIPDRPKQKRLVVAAKDVLEDTVSCVSLARALAMDRNNADKFAALQQGRKKLNETIQMLHDQASAVDTKDIDTAIANVEKGKVLLGSEAEIDKSFKEYSKSLQTSTKAVVAAAMQLSNVAKANTQLIGSVGKMASVTAMQLAGLAAQACATSPKHAALIGQATRELLDALKSLFLGAKSVLTSGQTRQSNVFESFAVRLKQVENAADKLLNCVGEDINPDVAFALKSVMDNLELFDKDQLQATASGQDALLFEFNQNMRDIASLTAKLVQGTKISAGKHGQYSREMAQAIETFLTTAQATNKSSLNTPKMALTPEGGRIVKGIDTILTFADDKARVIELMKIINLSAPSFVQKAIEKAKHEPEKDLRGNLVSGTQNFVPISQQLTLAAKNMLNSPGQAADPAFIELAKRLRQATLRLEQAIKASNEADLAQGIQTEAESVEVDPALANQIACASRAIALALHEVMRATSVVAANNDAREADDVAHEEMQQAMGAAQSLLVDFVRVCGGLNSGARECDKVLLDLQGANAKLDTALFESTVNNLTRPTAKPFQQGQAECAGTLKLLQQDIQKLVGAAGSTTSGPLKAAAISLRTNASKLATDIESTAASSPSNAVQKNLLTGTKLLNEELSLFVTEIQNANLKNKDSITRIAEASNHAQAALGALMNDLQTGAQLQADFDRICQQIKSHIMELANPEKPARNYGECRDSLIMACKGLSQTVNHLFKVDKNHMGQVGVSAQLLGEAAGQVLKAVRLCASTTSLVEAQDDLLDNANQLGLLCINIVFDVKQIVAGKDMGVKFAQDCDNSNKKIQSLLQAAKKGAIGDVLMEKAVEGINKRIQMLNTAAIFAEANQLEPNPQVQKLVLGDLQGMIEKDATRLLDFAVLLKKIVTDGSDEDLGKAAISIEKVLEQLANIATAVAQKLPDNLTQQDVLCSTKLIGFAVHQLILAAKDAQKANDNTSFKQAVDQAFSSLKDVTQAMTQSVKEIGDENARVERDMNRCIDTLRHSLQSTPAAASSSAADVMAQTQAVLGASAQLIFAGNQHDLTVAGEQAVAAVTELLGKSRAMASQAPDQQVADLLASSVNKTAQDVIRLLEVSKLSRSEASTQSQLEGAGEAVSQSITGIQAALRRFNVQNLDMSIEPEKEDLDYLAEQELMKCAKIIEDATASLTQSMFSLPPVKKSGKDVLNIDDINASIMDAATLIAKATAKLVEASVYAQRDRAKEMRAKGGAKYHADPMWANGLISASQLVAASVQELVHAANVISSKGKGVEEALVACARGVAVSTAHLVAASRSKADPHAESQKRLQAAAKEVAQATAKLVDSAQSIGIYEDAIAEEEVVIADTGVAVGGVRMAMEQNIKILSLEKQLEQERQRRNKYNQAKYAQGKK